MHHHLDASQEVRKTFKSLHLRPAPVSPPYGVSRLSAPDVNKTFVLHPALHAEGGVRYLPFLRSVHGPAHASTHRLAARVVIQHRTKPLSNSQQYIA